MIKDKNIFNRIKSMFTGEKKIENIVIIVILLIVMLISINYIFSNKDDENIKKDNTVLTNKNNENMNSTSGNVNINSNENVKDDLEVKLTNILNKISGITEASVMVSYSADTKKIPIYDVKQQENVQNEKEKTTTQKTVEKSVAYEEVNGKKTAIVESREMPIIEGVIVVAKGIYSTDLKNKIISAVAAVTDVPLYKVQVFERQ